MDSKDVATRLRRLGAKLSPPAPPARLSKLQRTLDCGLPRDVRELYLSFDGMRRPGRFPLVALSCDEICEAWEENEAEWRGLGFRPFWNDESGNYLGVYVEGPLQGSVLVMDHEELLLVPVFRSVERLYEAGLALAGIGPRSGLDGLLARADFPAKGALSADQEARDGALATAFFAEAKLSPGSRKSAAGASRTDRLRTQKVFCALTVIPTSEVQRIIALAHTERDYAGEFACSQLGIRGVTAAIPVLEERAVGADVLVAMAAIHALGTLATAGAAAALFRVAQVADDGLRSHMRCALQALGWVTRHNEEGGWSLRAGEDAPWGHADVPEWLAEELRDEDDRIAEQRRAWERLREGDGADVAAENDWSDMLKH